MFSREIESLRQKLNRASSAAPGCFDIQPGDLEAAVRALQQIGEPETAAAEQRLLLEARRHRQERFSGNVFTIAPLYVTSICRERCLYCNYRADSRAGGIDRVRLSDDEIAAESRFLIEEKGIRAIELVYASDPKNRADAIARHVELVARLLDERGGGIVGISAESLSEDEYRQLVAAGATFSILWQETYDRARYEELHPGADGKADFAWRIDAPERMIRAGIPAVGMGVLSGLSEWRQDWAMLVTHEAWLRNRFGRSASILGIPRLRPAGGAAFTDSSFLPRDSDLESAISIHTLFSPESVPFVSTREEWDFGLRLAAGGGVLFTFNCSTIPGGYSLGASGDQFRTGSWDIHTHAQVMRTAGMTPVSRWSFRDGMPAAG